LARRTRDSEIPSAIDDDFEFFAAVARDNVSTKIKFLRQERELVPKLELAREVVHFYNEIYLGPWKRFDREIKNDLDFFLCVARDRLPLLDSAIASAPQPD
jgi:hypothetical protein